MKEKVETFFYPDRNTTRIVKFIDDNNIFIRDLNKSDILVIEPYSDNYHSENISVLLADAMLKKDYEQAHKEIKEKMKRLFINLDKHSSKKSSEELLSTDFGFKAKDIYDLLERLHESIFNENIEDLSHIKYGMLFTPDSEKILAESDVINQINAYIEQYDRLISNSCIFRAAFNHTSAEEVYKTLKKEGFFRANHKIILEKSDELLGDEDLKTLISQEKERIIKTELADEFEKIDSLLSSKIGAKKLRDYIYENSEIIPELVDIAGLKKKIWKSYLKYESSVFEEAVLNYQHNKERFGCHNHLFSVTQIARPVFVADFAKSSMSFEQVCSLMLKRKPDYPPIPALS